VVELGEEKGHEEWVALALGRTFVMAGVRRSEVGGRSFDIRWFPCRQSLDCLLIFTVNETSFHALCCVLELVEVTLTPLYH
jgi:hypothetical protein